MERFDEMLAPKKKKRKRKTKNSALDL